MIQILLYPLFDPADGFFKSHERLLNINVRAQSFRAGEIVRCF